MRSDMMYIYGYGQPYRYGSMKRRCMHTHIHTHIYLYIQGCVSALHEALIKTKAVVPAHCMSTYMLSGLIHT